MPTKLKKKMENKEIRKNLKYGDIQLLAATCGCSRVWVSRCLSKEGELQPAERNIVAIAQALAERRMQERRREIKKIIKSM